MFLQLKGWKTNLVFWIFLGVVDGFIYSHKDMNLKKFRTPNTKQFFNEESVELSQG